MAVEELAGTGRLLNRWVGGGLDPAASHANETQATQKDGDRRLGHHGEHIGNGEVVERREVTRPVDGDPAGIGQVCLTVLDPVTDHTEFAARDHSTVDGGTGEDLLGHERAGLVESDRVRQGSIPEVGIVSRHCLPGEIVDPARL